MDDEKKCKEQIERTIENTKELTDLADMIDQDIENIVSLHIQSEQDASHHQRMIERITANLGRPLFLYIVLSLIGLWIIIHLITLFFKFPYFDLSQLSWLDNVISISSLLISIMILVTQNRQEKLTAQRRHLDLEVSLLIDRKVSKLIGLVEELRKDTPFVENRHDAEAEAMKENADPKALLSSLVQTLEDATR